MTECESSAFAKTASASEYHAARECIERVMLIPGRTEECAPVLSARGFAVTKNRPVHLATRRSFERSGCVRHFLRMVRGGGMHFVEQVGGNRHATTATGTATGAHGELGHAPTTRRSGLTDIAFGDAIAKADVHGYCGPKTGNGSHFAMNENDCQLLPAERPGQRNAPVRCDGPIDAMTDRIRPLAGP
jgi:hypothetical protein